MITFQEFSFRYERGDELALKDMNLTIEEGGFVGIIGGSGAGKSTLLHAISGLIPHHYRGDFYGAVQVCGMDTVDSSPERIAACVGSVFQDVDAQMVAGVVEDEILFGLENFGVPKEQIEARMSAALEMVGIPELRHRNIDTLSGGQKQKVAICAITALLPKVLVLDEPTGELDPRSSRQVFEMLKKLNRELGMTIVVVEQKIALLCEYAKRLAVVQDGTIALTGSVREVLSHTSTLEDAGVNFPRVASLHGELVRRGLCQGTAPVSVDEAEEMARQCMAQSK